jgi:hypothetical protein
MAQTDLGSPAMAGPRIAAGGGPVLLLRAEGALVLAGAVFLYHALGLSWWLFAALFLVPDISMLGYLSNPRLGALAYNAGHTYLAPAALGLAAFLWPSPALEGVALIWVAHIGFDRMAGYGLKLSDSFHHTHLGRRGGR